MPGAGHSKSAVFRAIGALVALVAVVGFLVFGWSFNDAGSTVPTAIGIVVAAVAIGGTLYRRVYAEKGG